ncbi:MAG: hypothetical protein WA705_18305 [Candidatus Ozemobacteraceae bacterium]
MNGNGTEKAKVCPPCTLRRGSAPGKPGQTSRMTGGSRFPGAKWELSIQGILGIVAIGSFLLFLLVVRHVNSGKQSSESASASSSVSAKTSVTSAEKSVLTSWPVLQGDGIRMKAADGRMTALSPGNIFLTQDTEIELTGAKSQARLAFFGSGTILIQGKGQLLISSNGFSTNEAAFSASFKKGKHPFEVHVPGATLDIRGTMIRFDLWLAAGTIELVEGSVIVRPDMPEAKPIDWNAGERLSVKKNSVTRITTPPPKIRSTSPPQDDGRFAGEVSISHMGSEKRPTVTPRTSGGTTVSLEATLRDHIPEPPPGREQVSH